jgi:hypothetical protein
MRLLDEPEPSAENPEDEDDFNPFQETYAEAQERQRKRRVEEELRRLLLPTPNLRALLDPTGLSPREIATRLPLAWRELREGGVLDVAQLWDQQQGGPPVLSWVTEDGPAGDLPLAMAFCVALGHFRFLSRQTSPHLYHDLLAKDVLSRERQGESENPGKDKDGAAGQAEPEGLSVETLARALFLSLKEAYEEIRLFEADPRCPTFERGMLVQDARAARFYEKLGPEGKNMAEQLRKKSRALFTAHEQKKPYATHALWSSCWASPKGETSPLMFAWVLCRTLWRDQINEQVKRIRQNPPGLSKLCFEQVQENHLRRWTEDPAVVGDHHLELRDGKNSQTVQLAGLSPRELDALLRALKSTGNLTWHRVLRHVLTVAHEQTLQGAREPYSLFYVGGVSALAEACGERSEQGRERIVEVLRVGQWLRLTWPGGEAGGLWTYKWDENTTRGKHALLQIHLAPVLRPYYGLRHLKSDPWIVPIVPLPSFVSAPRTHAGQAALQNRILVELLSRRVDLITRGGALLMPEEVDRLSDESGLTRETGRLAFAHWQKGEKAFLEKTGPDRFTLADNELYGPAKRFYETAAKRTLEGRARGIKSHQPKPRPTRKNQRKPTSSTPKKN